MRSLVRMHLAASGRVSANNSIVSRGLLAEARRCGHRGSRLSSSMSAAAPMAPTMSRQANVVSTYGAGDGHLPPPPPAPKPGAAERMAEERAIRIAYRQAARDALTKRDSRLWKAARVIGETEKTKEKEASALLIGLDSRTVRHPTTRQPLRLPAHKQLLAHALAVEWDQLASIRQASQGHRVPLMSLVCRAVDLEAEAEAEAETAANVGPLRTALIANLLRYLDTDSLLCWEDEGGESRRVAVGHGSASTVRESLTLHQLQRRTAEPILAYVREHVWPGLDIQPVLGDGTNPSRLLPRPHPPPVREAVQRWLLALDSWDLAGVERATLAGKSILVAARLVGGWQQHRAQPGLVPNAAFSAEEAVAATNMEIAFQTALWGEVEDTHDVEAADMRRHFGSAVLLVAE